VVKPFQDLLIDAFDQILAYNGISLNLYFETLQPLEFKEEVIEDIDDKEVVEEETGIKMSAIPTFNDETKDVWLNHLGGLGEKENLEDWELMDVEDTGDEPEEFNVEEYLNKLTLSTQIVSKPKEKSSLDTKFWKVRYKYVIGTKQTPKTKKSREFCNDLIKANKIYRKEDIDIMSFKGVNNELGHNGQNYSLFKFKGGVNCYHRWERRVYKKKLKEDGSPWGGDSLFGTKFKNVNQAIREGWKKTAQPIEVHKAPIDMPNQGHYPGYKKGK
jgi:hypothetical protein